jgi:hypothetical protein
VLRRLRRRNWVLKNCEWRACIAFSSRRSATQPAGDTVRSIKPYIQLYYVWVGVPEALTPARRPWRPLVHQGRRHDGSPTRKFPFRFEPRQSPLSRNVGPPYQIWREAPYHVRGIDRGFMKSGFDPDNPTVWARLRRRIRFGAASSCGKPEEEPAVPQWEPPAWARRVVSMAVVGLPGGRRQRGTHFCPVHPEDHRFVGIGSLPGLSRFYREGV